MSFELAWVEFGSADYLGAVELRRQVLRLPLDLDFTAEELADDAQQLHLVCKLEGELVGCLVLRPHGDELIQMRQVAVAPGWQGSGFGREMVIEAEREAKRRGFSQMMLHARQHVAEFYSRLGYELEGPPFEEVGMPHVKMVKRL